jgi:hypothetical protein
MMKAAVFAGLVATFHVGAMDRFQPDGMHALPNSIAQGTTEAGSEKNQQILQQWNGDYPVSALGRLPKAQRNAPVGFIADARTFKSVWQAFMPGAEAPHVDFAADLVLFARNVEFYNHTSIAAVKLKNGVLDVVAMETMSSQPIKDKVALAMVVVSREGVTTLKTSDKLLRIPAAASKQ